MSDDQASWLNKMADLLGVATAEPALTSAEQAPGPDQTAAEAVATATDGGGTADGSDESTQKETQETESGATLPGTGAPAPEAIANTASLAIQVVDEKDAPVAGATIHISLSSSGAIGTTDSSGTAYFSGLPAGDFIAHASHDGRTGQTPIHLEPSQPSQVRITLRGQPVSSEDAPPSNADSISSNDEQAATTVEEGGPSGLSSIGDIGEEGGEQPESDGRGGDGKEAGEDDDPDRMSGATTGPYFITVNVKSEGPEKVEVSVARIQPEEPRVWRKKDCTGKPVLFENLPAGKYYIRAKQGERTKPATLTFPGPLAEVHLDLTPKTETGSIRVFVYWGSGPSAHPASNATVKVRGGGVLEEGPAPDGERTISGVEPGEYSVNAWVKEQMMETGSGSAPAKVESGKTTTVAVYLEQEKQTSKKLRADDGVRTCVVHPDQVYVLSKGATTNWLAPKRTERWERKVAAEFEAAEARITEETKNKLIERLNQERPAIERKYSPDRVEFEFDLDPHEWAFYHREFGEKPEVDQDGNQYWSYVLQLQGKRCGSLKYKVWTWSQEDPDG